MSHASENRPAQEQIAAALTAFSYPSPAKLMRCAALHERVAELAVTYPLILMVLASGWGPLGPRRKAIRMIVQGQRLGEVAEILGLPMCFRRIPPSALQGKPPHCRFPGDASRKLSPLLPDPAAITGRWLPLVTRAQRLGGLEFAAWLARSKLLEHSHIAPASLRPLALYVWHATGEPEPTVPDHLRRLVPRPWSPRNALKSTVLDARMWFNRVKMIAYFTPFGILDPWIDAGQSGAYTIQPMVYAEELLDEAVYMGNCMEGYAERLAADHCRLFRVSRDGDSIAAVEIRRSGSFYNRPGIGQIKGPDNAEVTAEIARAIMNWYLPQSERLLPPATPRNKTHECQVLRRLLAPCIAASQASTDPWFSQPSWQLIDSEMCNLALSIGLRHWAFTQL